MEPLRLVQVGLGGWGVSWVRDVLPGTPDVQVLTWADTDPGRRAAFTAATGVPAAAVVATLTEALDAGPADAVLVTAGIAAHEPLVRQALLAGRHVLVEKPFTTDLRSAAALVRLAEERGRRLVVAQNYRFFPAVVAVRRLLGDAVVGQVQHVDVRLRRADVAPMSVPGPPGSPDLSVLNQLTVHHGDLLRALLRTEAEAVTARAWRHGQRADRLLSAFSAQVEMADGTFVDLSAHWASRSEPTPWTGAWRIEGDAGELRWWGRDPADGCGIELWQDGRVVDRPEVTVPDRHDRAAVVAELVRLVREGGRSEIDGAANLGTVALLDACARSLATGERTLVAVPPV